MVLFAVSLSRCRFSCSPVQLLTCSSKKAAFQGGLFTRGDWTRLELFQKCVAEADDSTLGLLITGVS